MHAARHKPRPAWREPAWEPQRIDFDYAYAVSAAGDTGYYASSSDHALHALDLRTGRLVWKYRPDVPDSRLIGNEQMISRWPARSGVLVEGDRVYTTFGMLSPEGGSSCQCAYNYKTSLALMSDPRHFHFGIGGSAPPRRSHSSSSPATPTALRPSSAAWPSLRDGLSRDLSELPARVAQSHDRRAARLKGRFCVSVSV